MKTFTCDRYDMPSFLSLSYFPIDNRIRGKIYSRACWIRVRIMGRVRHVSPLPHACFYGYRGCCHSSERIGRDLPHSGTAWWDDEEEFLLLVFFRLESPVMSSIFV